MKAMVERTFRCVLAVWMLAASSVSSSTYVHTHGGGSVAHQHDGETCATSGHVASTDDHDGGAVAVSLSGVDEHSHGCLVWLGMATYHSTHNPSSGLHEQKACRLETIVSISAAQTARTSLRDFWGNSFGPVSQAALSTECPREWKQSDYSCAGSAPAYPLCDRARHERSGVLLA
jgi:hypothetical protein